MVHLDWCWMSLLTFGAIWTVGASIKAAPPGGLMCVCNLCANKTCFTDGVCLSQLFRQQDGSVARWDNCLAKNQLFPPENPLLCLGSANKRETSVIECCSSYDYCNRDSNITLAPAQTTTTGLPPLGGFAGLEEDHQTVVIIVGVAVVLVLLVLGISFFLYRRKTSAIQEKNNAKEEGAHLLEAGLGGDGLSSLVQEMTSGSGSGSELGQPGTFRTGGSGDSHGKRNEADNVCRSVSRRCLPLLIQRTIARQVTLVQQVGKGRYGEVYLGKWRGENIAVKLFSTRDENSWKREVEIYQTMMLRHENLLGFIAADNKDNGLVTQLWLITEYHENGSLFDYLTKTVIDVQAMLRLSFSLANGLAHLHMDIVGTSALGKPAIAHRDVKSKNVLVKRNGQCALADLGLAVAYDGQTGTVDIPNNDKVGTVRYLAPEVLDGNLNVKNFEALKSVDVYALALVLWEICHRCQFLNGPAEDYELPYSREVPSDPDIPQMKEVVSAQKKRPCIPNQWSTCEPMQTMCRLLRECWYHNPQARLTALRVKKTIAQLIAAGDVKL